MGEMKRLVPADLKLGEPLLFSIFDERGNLLLRKGTVIAMPDQIDRLVHRGALADEIELRAAAAPARAATQRPPAPSAPKEPPFERIGSLTLNLKHVLATFLKTPEQIDLPARIARIAQAIQDICAEDIDSALAAPYLDAQNGYIVVHQIMGGVLTELIARRKQLPPEQRLAMVCGALTRDLDQIALQTELDKVDGPLPEPLRGRMRQHPSSATERLQAAGVGDGIWLDGVRGHHERLDGSGYPHGLRNGEIPLAARILAVADIFSAMTKPRPYRSRQPSPQAALREVHALRGSSLDGELANLLLQEVGMFPPGSTVRLKCGEIAVVRSPALKAEEATVFSIYGRNGMVLGAPARRDVTAPEFEIAGTVPLAECRSASIMMKRIWAKETT